MSRWISILLALVALLAPVLGQTHTPAYVVELQKGIDALNAGKHDEGIAIFKRLLEKNPNDAVCAYNVACGYAKKGDVESAFVYLTQAADKGFGSMDTPQGQSHVDFLGVDKDIEALRKDARYAPIVEKMRALRTVAQKYAATPAIYIPERIRAWPEKPVLVVCHDQGETKDRVIAGPWKSVADELGYALVAPSGKYPMRGEPQEGIAWFLDALTYTSAPARYHQSVHAAFEAFQKEHKVDREHVYICGEGGGAIVASAVALSKPDVYKAAVLLEGVLVPGLFADNGRNAGKLGLRVRFLNDPVRLREALGEGEDVAATLAEWNALLRTWGIRGGAEEYDAQGLGVAGRTRVIVQTLSELAQVPLMPFPLPDDASAGAKKDPPK